MTPSSPKYDITPRAVPLDSLPGPSGCPAIHMLEAERAAFRAEHENLIKVVNRVALIATDELDEWGAPDAETKETLDVLDRIRRMALWSLTGNVDWITDADRAVLAPPAFPRLETPVASSDEAPSS